jgi:hypothetical protein
MGMATKNPRLQILLEKPLYAAVAALADEEGVSMSTKARDLIREALEHLEDVALSEVVDIRARKPAKLLAMAEMRRRLGA